MNFHALFFYLSKISIFISSFNIHVTKKSVKNTNAKFITALYCKPHYTQLFKLRGKYEDGPAPAAAPVEAPPPGFGFGCAA